MARRVNFAFATALGIGFRELLDSLPARTAIFALRLTAVGNGYDPAEWEERALRRARESDLEVVDAAQAELKQLRRLIATRKRWRRR